MLAGIRITDQIRLWRLCRHLGQVALGAQVGLGASTLSADQHGDGDLFLGGIPLARWNEAVKVQRAMDIAKLSAGTLGLIIVDGLERVDGVTFEAFVNFVRDDESSGQYLVTRVTDDLELTVTTS
jgi:hypothetical protein